jgi:hypothetical protein
MQPSSLVNVRDGESVYRLLCKNMNAKRECRLLYKSMNDKRECRPENGMRRRMGMTIVLS